LIFLKKSIEEYASHSYSMFSVFLQSPLILDSEEVKEALNKSPSEKNK